MAIRRRVFTVNEGDPVDSGIDEVIRATDRVRFNVGRFDDDSYAMHRRREDDRVKSVVREEIMHKGESERVASNAAILHARRLRRDALRRKKLDRSLSRDTKVADDEGYVDSEFLDGERGGQMAVDFDGKVKRVERGDVWDDESVESVNESFVDDGELVHENEEFDEFSGEYFSKGGFGTYFDIADFDARDFFVEVGGEEFEARFLEFSDVVRRLFNSINGDAVAQAGLARAFGGLDYLRVLSDDSVFDVGGFLAFEHERALKRGYVLKVPDSVSSIDWIALPPGERENRYLRSRRVSRGDGLKLRRIPRNMYLVEALTEIGVNYELLPSGVSIGSARGEGYSMYYLPDEEKVVCVNDEEGNASFVIFGISERGDVEDVVGSSTKGELRYKFSSIVDSINWSASYDYDPELWKSIVKGSIARGEAIGLNDSERPVVDIADAVSRLIDAHKKWIGLDDGEKFTYNWIRAHGDSNVISWIYYRNAQRDVRSLIEVEDSSFFDDFSSLDRRIKSAQMAAKFIVLAYNEWKESSLGKKKKGKFNVHWLKNNGYLDLVSWVIKRSFRDRIVKELNGDYPDIFSDFKYQESRFDYSIKAGEFAEYYSEWKNSGTSSRFSSPWLNQNGHKRFAMWLTRGNNFDGVMAALIMNNIDICYDFVPAISRNAISNVDDVISGIEEAYHVWSKRSEKGSFNMRWMGTHGFSNVITWMNRKFSDQKPVVFKRLKTERPDIFDAMGL